MIVLSTGKSFNSYISILEMFLHIFTFPTLSGIMKTYCYRCKNSKLVAVACTITCEIFYFWFFFLFVYVWVCSFPNIGHENIFANLIIIQIIHFWKIWEIDDTHSHTHTYCNNTLYNQLSNWMKTVSFSSSVSSFFFVDVSLRI